jgi:hypothetical protein
MTARKTEETLDAVFVQSAGSFSASNGEITLHDVADATVYFATHPQREAGHIPSRRFAELWEGYGEGFAASPPTAVISFLDDTASAPPDVVITVHEPRFHDQSMTYRVEVRHGDIPSSAGPCSLFIDALHSPLAPAAVSLR